MNTLARVPVLFLIAVLVRLDASAMAQDASVAEGSACATCHGEADRWNDDTQRLYITADHFAGDAHWQKGLRCGDCHGGNAETLDESQAHRIEDGFRPLDSPADIIPFCGRCHAESLNTYSQSVHGLGLSKSGLLVTAVCTSCHGSHGIFSAEMPQSLLHVSNVAQTCSQCHRFIHERLQQSVHAQGSSDGPESDRAAPGGNVKRPPNCTDCHRGHDLPHPASVLFRQQLSNRCGDCHDDLQQQYSMSMHGELTDLGYGPAANCADCHGDHEIVPISAAASLVGPENRLATCQKCHPGAPPNFADFDPHANHRDPQSDPFLYAVYVTLMTLLLGTIGVFTLHSALWFFRSLIDLRKHPRPRGLVPGEIAYVRFSSFHRMAHVALLISFLGLTLTGLPLKYSHTDWAKMLAGLLGGFATTGLWHRIFGLVNIAYLVLYLLWVMYRMATKPRILGSMRAVAFSGDSPIPNWRDWSDFVKTMRWFVGRGPKPSYERWAYWEKIDIFGAMADIVIIGFTGLILWFPELFTSVLPGKTLNFAKVIHSTQALLATGFVFAIHFYNTHIRPEKFPMDLSMFAGLVSDEEMREERADYYERLRSEGRLEELQAVVPSRRFLLFATFGGAIAVAIGLSLLVGIVVALVKA